MNKMRLLGLTTLSALAISIPAFSQGSTLNEDDTTLLNNALMSTAAASSFSYDFALALDADVSGAGAVANIVGNGVVFTDANNPSFSLAVSGSVEANGEETPVDLELRFVDSMVYVLAEGEWHGITAEDFASNFTQGFSSGAGISVDPEEVASGDISDLAEIPGFSQAMAGLSALDPETFIFQSRLDDMDGSAHFSTELSLSDLFGQPAFLQLFTSATTGDTSLQQMSDAELQQLGTMMSQMFGNASITFDQFVDTSTNYLDRAVVDVNLPLPAAMGLQGTILFNFDVALASFDEAEAVVAPENFTLESGNS